MTADATTCQTCGRAMTPRPVVKGSPRKSCGDACAQRAAWRAKHGLPVSDAGYLEHLEATKGRRAVAAFLRAACRRQQA